MLKKYFLNKKFISLRKNICFYGNIIDLCPGFHLGGGKLNFFSS